MRRIIVFVVLLCAALAAQTVTTSIADFGDDDLQRVEELKPEESAELAKAHEAVDKANAELVKVELKIAGQHGMGSESYAEWYSWTAIHGRYILHYFHSNMRSR